MINADPSTAGGADWQVAAWMLVLLLAGLLLLDVRKDVTRVVSARNVVLIGLFAWYGLEALLPGAALDAYSSQAVAFGLLLVGLGAWCFLYGYRAIQLRLFDRIGQQVHTLENSSLQWQVLVIAAVIGFIPVFIYGGLDLRGLWDGILGMRKTWGGPLGRGALGDFRSAVLMLEKCVWGVSWLAIIFLLNRKNPLGARLFALVLLSWTLLRAYGSGTRSLLFSAVLIPSASLFWLASYRWRRRLVLALPLVAASCYWLAMVMVAGRLQGGLSYEIRPNYIGHEMFRELLFIVDAVPEKYSYLLGNTYVSELVSPIPRFLWPSKPYRFGIEYAAWHGQDALAGAPNLSPGILGEMYANFGVIGIVVCSFIGGVVCRAWDRLRMLHGTSVPVMMFYTAGLAVLFTWGRSATVAALYPMIASFLCLIIVSRSWTARSPWQSKLHAEDVLEMNERWSRLKSSTVSTSPIGVVSWAWDGDRPRVLGNPPRPSPRYKPKMLSRSFIPRFGVTWRDSSAPPS